MLLAGLQRQAIGGLTAGIDRQPDNAPGQRALQRLAHRHKGRVRPAISHRHSERCADPIANIGAEVARRGQKRQRQQIRATIASAPFARSTAIAGLRSRTMP